MQNLGSLKRLDARNVWRNEALDFTPWLSQHLGDLGRALGMELELKTTEAPVGGFSLDILAHDLNRDRIVVLENQLASTDHDHLGKLLTYASGYNAAAIVWIAPEFREEHRQTLDWLNQHTDSGTDFFGVVVEVLQIDDSRPAPDFRLVAAPNQWRKERVNTGEGTQVSERGEAYRAFFQELVDELREKYRFTGARVGQPQNWYSFATGRSGISFNPVFASGGRVRTELYIDVGNEATNKAIFDSLLQLRASIETEFDESLDWERLDGKRASRISVGRNGQIESSAQELAGLRGWFVQELLKFKKVFGPKIAQLGR